MTDRLFDEDSHIRTFTARVLACTSDGGRFRVELDRTAFFPEGGGQRGDRGTLGGAAVLDTQETERVIFHITDAPLAVGSEVTGEIDWELRFANMQGHSAEHIISGIVHSLFGYSNVGFHIGEQVTMDFDGELTDDDITRIEAMANDAVYDDRVITARYPSAEELAALEYRSKLELTENVRIVTVEGIDSCACCAPHVAHTGEIGVIKITDAMRHRGGMRLFMLAGRAAYRDYAAKSRSAAELSAMLSAKRDELPAAVSRVMSALDDARRQLAAAELTRVRARAAALPAAEGSVCIFEDSADPNVLRELCNLAAEKSAAAAVFSGTDGDYRYVIGSSRIDLRAAAKTVNAAINGRGGGSSSMIQGSCTASSEAIRAFFEAWPESAETRL